MQNSPQIGAIAKRCNHLNSENRNGMAPVYLSVSVQIVPYIFDQK